MAAERDPHGIVPDGFYDRWDSVKQASIHASVDSDERDRGCCPECGSTLLRYRSGGHGAASPPAHASDKTYTCRNCGNEFDEPEGGQ